MPQKQANPQKALERPTVKKRHRKTEGRSHNSIYERPPFSRTGVKRRPFFGKPDSEKQNDSHAPRALPEKIGAKPKQNRCQPRAGQKAPEPRKHADPLPETPLKNHPEMHEQRRPMNLPQNKEMPRRAAATPDTQKPG